MNKINIDFGVQKKVIYVTVIIFIIAFLLVAVDIHDFNNNDLLGKQKTDCSICVLKHIFFSLILLPVCLCVKGEFYELIFTFKQKHISLFPNQIFLIRAPPIS